MQHPLLSLRPREVLMAELFIIASRVKPVINVRTVSNGFSSRVKPVINVRPVNVSSPG